jgi:hypothetical protein
VAAGLTEEHLAGVVPRPQRLQTLYAIHPSQTRPYSIESHLTACLNRSINNHFHHVMASGPPTGQPITALPSLHFYPAYCNKASPTYFTWVKLTASDIHHVLRSRPGFVNHNNNTSYQRQPSASPTSLLFYLNHPIQFVCIVGIVVALDDYDLFRVFTVDDSSGATIDVTCRKPKEQGEPGSAQQNSNATLPQAGTVKATDDEDDGTLGEASARMEVLSHIDVGSVVKVKGTISAFRSVRQIALERLEVVLDTNAEVRFWTQRTQLFADVLLKPWKLSVEEQKQLLKEAEGEVEDLKERAARRVERLAKEQKRKKRHAEKIAKAYEVEERERQRVAEQMRQHGLSLRVEGEDREQERTVEKPNGEERAQLGKTALNGHITNLRDLVSSK